MLRIHVLIFVDFYHHMRKYGVVNVNGEYYRMGIYYYYFLNENFHPSFNS